MREALPAEEKSRLDRNVSALEAVQPQDLTAGEIGVRIGANWVPISDYEDFMYELFGTSYFARLDNARTELEAPFAKEDELTEKSKRLNELNILLNLDQKDKTLIDNTPDEDTPQPSRSQDYER